MFNRRMIPGLLLIGGIAIGGLSLLAAGAYGWTIFVVLPALLGAVASWIAQPRRASGAAAVGACAGSLALLSLFAGGLEGLGCSLMAMPLILPAGALGGWLARAVSRPRDAVYFLLLPPATLAYDASARPPLYEVRTAIEIAAPPEVVWRSVVAFPELPPPREWYFHTGLAYPLRARIDGSGPGAVRYCEFSTGPFVEPIETWDEPRLLRFRVTANPAPMREWSPYGEVHPKHLHGYLVSEQGQFRLTPLPGGRTSLAGTTWYRHGLWPAQYWRWWSDAIIHRIHLRVLKHIQSLAESQNSVSVLPLDP